MMKCDILAVWVHPDDVEICCGWTLLKHIAKWYTVALVDMTQGELGTRWSADLRLQEAEAARVAMWAMWRENLGMRDGFFQHTENTLRLLIKALRKYQPEIVFANALSDRHPDHGRAADLVADACFYAWLRKIDTGQDVRRPRLVLHYTQDQYHQPDIVVDVSDYMEQKRKVMQCYASQFYQESSTEPHTPISWKDFFEHVRSTNRLYGRPIGAAYAEWFRVQRYIWVDDVFDLQ